MPLSDHSTPFAEWYSRYSIMATPAVQAELWADVRAAARLGRDIGVTDVEVWTPQQLEAVGDLLPGLSLYHAQSLVQALRLFVQYLVESRRWAGSQDLADASWAVLTRLADELDEVDALEDEPWYHERDDDRDDDLDHRHDELDLTGAGGRVPAWDVASPEFQRALAHVAQVVGPRDAGRAS